MFTKSRLKKFKFHPRKVKRFINKNLNHIKKILRM